MAVAPNGDMTPESCGGLDSTHDPGWSAKPEGSEDMTHIERLGSNVAHAVLFVVALSATAPADAQTETEPRVWMAVSLQGPVSELDSPWRWVADSQVGMRNGAGTMDFMAEWVSVSRDLTRRSSAGVGYAFGAGFPDAGFLREHRFVQQYVWRTDAAGPRCRSEHNWRSGSSPGRTPCWSVCVRGSAPDLAADGDGIAAGESSRTKCSSGPTPRCGRLVASTATSCLWASGGR